MQAAHAQPSSDELGGTVSRSPREVSCRALGVVLDSVAARGISLDALLGSIPIDPKRLLDQNDWISWDTFVTILDNLYEELDRDEAELVALGYENFGTQSFEFMRRVASFIVRPRDLYWMGTAWFGPALFTVVEDRFEDLPEGQVRETLTVPDGFPGCRPLFKIMEGAMRAAPGLLRRPDAMVELELDAAGRVAIYTITPPSRASARAVFRSFGRGLFGGRRFIEELTHQQNHLKVSRDRLYWANRKIEAQTERLRAAERMARELAQHIELQPLTEAIFEALRPLIPDRGIALHINGLRDEKSRELGRTGQTRGTPARTHPMEIGGSIVGRLELWPNAEGSVNGKAALVMELLPWIAIALDNARAHEAVRDYSTQLETRVKETATERDEANGHLESERLERDALLEKLRRTAEQLRLVEAVASLNNHGVDIARQLVEPIATILKSAARARRSREELSDPAKIAETLLHIERRALAAGGIVSGLSSFVHNEPVEQRQVDVNDVAELAAADVRGYAKQRGALVDVVLWKDPCLVDANRAQLEQAISSLLRNGIDAAESRGRVHLATESTPTGVRITVTDNGPGIPPVDLERIFELFYSTRRRQGQSGVGLSAARSIVAGHDGTLRAESDDSGATFVIELPTAPAASPHAEPRDASAGAGD